MVGSNHAAIVNGMTKSIAEQLAPLKGAITVEDTPVRRSRPRCMCHMKYLELCPNTPKAEVERVQGIMEQVAVLDTPLFQPRDKVLVRDQRTETWRPAVLDFPEVHGYLINARREGWRFRWLDVQENTPRWERGGWAPMRAIRVPVAPIDLPDPPPMPKCRKHGHKSEGAARAQLRSIMNRDSVRNRDKKNIDELTVYRCRHRECKSHPWHVGHDSIFNNEGDSVDE